MAQLPAAAAVAAAAANAASMKEETDALEDVLDLDDSDIRFEPPPLPRSYNATASHSQPQPQQHKPPPQPSHLHHHHRSTAPAADVQDTVLPRSFTRPPLSTGRGVETDAEFLRPPWLCALQFLGKEKDSAWERPGIRAIKDDEELFRAPLVAGVVTSCKPNGLGDLFLTLKDPTGSISASVHKKALLEMNDDDISVGCAVIFSKVAVFRSSRRLCYLNVTKGKVTKVFSKDCAAPCKRVISSSTTERSQGEDSTSNIIMRKLGREDMIPSDKEMTITEVSCKNHTIPDPANSTSTRDIFGMCSVGSNQEDKLPVGGPHSKHTPSCSTDGNPQQNISIPNICLSTPKENVNTSSGSGLTDEQLSELLADY